MKIKMRTFNGDTVYVLFSMEKPSEGGRWSKKEARKVLAENGIKTSTTDAHTIYVGQYGLWVEAKFQEKASKLLFG